MGVVRLTKSYRVTIPPQIRKALNIKPGDKFDIVANGGHFKLTPLPSAKVLHHQKAIKAKIIPAPNHHRIGTWSCRLAPLIANDDM
jgi:AbrB family looped-hinge helix DNA binding protein